MGRFDITKEPVKSNRFNATSTSNGASLESTPVPAKPASKGVFQNVVDTMNQFGSDFWNPKATANTPGVIARNTVLGLPKATLDTGVDLAQGIARSVGTVGATAGNAPTQIVNKFLKPENQQDLPFQDEIQTDQNPVTKAIFGGKPVRTLQGAIGHAEEVASPYIGDTASKIVSPPLVVGSILLDLTGWGGKAGVKPFVKGEIPEAFFKFIAKEKSPEVIESTLKTVGVGEQDAKILSQKLSTTGTVKDAKDVWYSHETPAAPVAPKSIEAPTTKSIFEQDSLPFESKPIFSQSETPKPTPLQIGETQFTKATGNDPQKVASLESLGKIIEDTKTPASQKVNIIDYIRTPEPVLKKFGLGQNAVDLRNAYDSYLTELPKNIDKITNWSKLAPTPEDNVNIFRALDGKKVDLTPVQTKIVGEIRPWLSELADRLGLKPDERITDYITHIFPPGKGGELNEDIAKLISGKVPGSVYDPYLLKRQGVEGYIEDTWKALDAYVKTATRKIHMDPALADLKEASKNLELSQLNYVKRFADRVNMRPTELDNLIDNGIKSVVGYRMGVRPTKNITRTARQIVSRAKLGFSFTSAMKNMTQGINTFSELGTKYTTKGYTDLLTKGAKELRDNNVISDSLADQDRTYNAVKKFWEKFDRATFFNFEATELINRGAAYYGGKAKALAQGKTEAEAIQYGKDIAGKTQFRFGSIDTPVGLGSDIMKTATQFQTFTLKQMEFLAEKLKNKEYASLARYLGAAAVVFGTIGGAFGMSLWDMFPSLRFGAPPAADLPIRAYKDATGAKDQYGRVPTGAARLRDAADAVLTDIVPGGAQIKRTVQGIDAVAKGKSTTAAGNFQYSIPQTPLNYARAGLFGKTNLPEAKAYYDKKAGGSSKTSTTNRFNTY